MLDNKLKFAVSALGIFVFYGVYGILQEAITKGVYVVDSNTETEHAEKFTYTLSLVCVQCVVNYFYANILLQTIQRPKPTDAKISNQMYAICSLTYLLAMVSSNLALQWVSYPTQVIAKSCKPIPVMILGVLLASKQYTLKKYLFILLIVLGVALFMYKPNQQQSTSTITGDLLLIMSLSMDGLTGAIQERMRHNNKPNSSTMMKMMNVFSIFYCLIGLFVTGEIITFSNFVARHPNVVWKILVFSVCSALGQHFIYVLVSEFGPLACSVVTTTRKFFTVLFSVIFFGNVISWLQWVGVVCVFLGLGLDAGFK